MKKIVLGMFVILMLSFIFIYIASENEEILVVEALDSFTFGMSESLGTSEILEFTYDGDYVRFLHDVEGFTYGLDSELGWFLYVDGLPQNTQLELKDGSILSESNFLHHFSVGYREKIEFYVVFRPSSGTMGSTVNIISGAIMRPKFLPTIEEPSFLFTNELAHTGTSLLSLERGSRVRRNPKIITNLEMINDEIRQAEINWSENHIVLNSEFEMPRRVIILPLDETFDLNFSEPIHSEGNEINFRFVSYGGDSHLNRITFFVNHEPVQINGYDYLEVIMEQGEMLDIELSIEIGDLSVLNSIYAVMTTPELTGPRQTLYKSPSLLLVNN